MSYLTGPQLHFAGRFQADVSTVNNDVRHFNNATFKPEYQEPGKGATKGWWNPHGTGYWRLIDCRVTQASRADGTVVQDTAADPIIGMSVAQTNDRVAAKLVDLDPQQQLVSQIWGLTVRLTDGGNGSIFSGAFAMAPFSDLWSRTPNAPGGDFSLACFWQSVLVSPEWGELPDSAFLRELRDAAGGRDLSIKFNVDGYSMDSSAQDFTTGRIVGTIGIAADGEPRHFVLGRQAMPVDNSPANFFPAVVDAKRGKLVLDLGNALPTATVGGPVDPTLNLNIGILTTPGQIASLGTVIPDGPDWYERTAGIVELPADRPLSQNEIALLADHPIVLANQTVDGSLQLLAQEPADGLYVRADQFVFRLSPGDRQSVNLYATRFGQPLAGAAVTCTYDDSGLQQGGPRDPKVGTPTKALDIDPTVTTGTGGLAELTLTAHDPNDPRGYIDGQVYGIGYSLPGSTYVNSSDFVSVLVWNRFDVLDTPTWQDVQPMFQQFANLYPIMKPIVDMGDYAQMAAKAGLVKLAMSLPEEDPNYMPVTRDLSPAKRKTMLNWLDTKGADGKPVFGAPANPALAAAAAPAEAPVKLGANSKTEALRRRNSAALPVLTSVNLD
jgi:hypothetical protein